MRTGRPSRLRAFDYRGYHRYFLTFCTLHRQRFFVSAAAVDCVLSQFRRAGHATSIALTAYCFMPDHVHLLVEGVAEDSDGKTFISKAKQLSAFHFKRQFGVALWQHYGYEHVMRPDEDTMGVARYLLSNPLRAGLCTRVADYPFIGSDSRTVAEIIDAVQMMKPG